MPDDVTLGEVNRKLDQVAGNVRDIQTTVGLLPTFRDVAALEARVTKTEDWQTWFIRIALALVIVGVIGAAFAFKV